MSLTWVRAWDILFKNKSFESGVAGLNDLATPNIRSSTTRQVSTANCVSYVVGRTDPGIALDRRQASLAYQVSNVVNKFAQLIARDILLAAVYGAQRSVQLRKQAVFLLTR